MNSTVPPSNSTFFEGCVRKDSLTEFQGGKLIPKRIDLKTAIAALRAELIDSILASQNEPLRFEVGKISMQFQLEIKNYGAISQIRY